VKRSGGGEERRAAERKRRASGEQKSTPETGPEAKRPKAERAKGKEARERPEGTARRQRARRQRAPAETDGQKGRVPKTKGARDRETEAREPNAHRRTHTTENEGRMHTGKRTTETQEGDTKSFHSLTMVRLDLSTTHTGTAGKRQEGDPGDSAGSAPGKYREGILMCPTGKTQPHEGDAGS
jgi:hypothetical protein